MDAATEPLVVIPARYASTRLPRKMLLSDTGMSLLEHTYRAASQSTRAADVIVATDHHEIAAEVERFGGQVIMTSDRCASGTDRVAEVARQLSKVDILVNVQGDEPEMDPSAIDQLIDMLSADRNRQMATLATPITEPEKITDPACVKVVCDDLGNALYFSRSPIPFHRDEMPESSSYWQHLGIYAYRRDFLMRLAATPPSSLERAESLEQLRVLQMGARIQVGTIPAATKGIDTLADYQAFVARQRAA